MDDRWHQEVEWVERDGLRRRGHQPDLARGARRPVDDGCRSRWSWRQSGRTGCGRSWPARELDRRRARPMPSSTSCSEPRRSRACAAPWLGRRPVSRGPDAARGDARRNPRRSRGRLREPPSRCAGRRHRGQPDGDRQTVDVRSRTQCRRRRRWYRVQRGGCAATPSCRHATSTPPPSSACSASSCAALLGWRVGELVLLPIAAPWVAAASAGHRWRQSDLGAGEELRAHELSRRWIWEPRRRLPAGRAAVSGLAGRARARATVA